MDKGQLIREYIKNNNLDKNSKYRKYIELAFYKIGYQDSFNSKIDHLNYFIKDYLEDYLFDKDYTGEFNYKEINELISDVEEYDNFEIVDRKIDIHYEDLMNSYKVFDEWLDITERNNISIIETIQMAQSNAYNELYQVVQYDVIEFLKTK